ncbi:MAG: PIG-L deacetylase family protein [Actinomycetota bacterium]|nr:PIG-L family deacetylase [Actinomycetota bacterium]
MGEGALSGRRIVAVYAHPDDESYTFGGCICKYTEEGAEVTVLTFTRGEAGTIGGGSDATPETLGEVRELELEDACKILGASDVRIFGTPDGGTKETEEGVQAIVDVLRELKPDILVTMEPHGVTRHPDHIAVSNMTERAFERARDDGFPKKFYFAAYPAAALNAFNAGLKERGIKWLDPDDPFYPQPADDQSIACVVDVMPWIDRKAAALIAHRTQSDEIINWLPEDMRGLFLGGEAFQRIHPPREKGEPAENDLFTGIR